MGVQRTPAGEDITLAQLFARAGIHWACGLTVERLGLMPSPTWTLFQHFDVFSRKRPGGGQCTTELLKVFLKTTCLQQGKYLAELVTPVLEVPPLTLSPLAGGLIAGLENWRHRAKHVLQ